MYQEVIKFFEAFFDKSFDSSALIPFFVGFTLTIIYGILVRPWLNLIGGTKE